MRVLIQNGYILTLDGQDRVLERGDVLIDGPHVVQIGAELDASALQPDQVIDAAHHLVAPGLVNADLHAVEVLSKGLFENQPLDLRPRPRITPEEAGPLAGELVYQTALVAGIQALETGVTTLQDHWRFPAAFACQGAAAVLATYRALGLRANLALEIEADPSAPDRLPAEQLMAVYQQALADAHSGDGERLQLALALPAHAMLNPQLVAWLPKLTERENLAVHFHFQQTKAQLLHAQQAFHGQTAIERAAQVGWLTPRASISSAVWLTPAEIDLLTARGVTVIHTPLSDLYAGSGMLPLHRLVAAGVPLALGTGETCGGNLTLLDTLKMTAQIHRVVQPDYHHWVSVVQSLTMATQGGARACRLEGAIGQIAVGGKADLVLYDLRGFAFSPLNNPKDQLVCLEDGSSVDTVLVDGQVVVQHGKLVAVDETDALQQFRHLFQQWSARGGAPAEPSPAQTEAYWAGVAAPLSIHRWADNPVLPSQLKQAFAQKGKSTCQS